MGTLRQTVRDYAELIIGGLLLAMVAGGASYCERVESAREDVAAKQDSIELERERRRADSARAERIEGRMAKLQDAVVAASRASHQAIARAERAVDSLSRAREEARAAAEEADSAFRSLAVEVAEEAPPSLAPKVKRLAELHTETVEEKQAEVDALEQTAEEKDRVIQKARAENRALRVAYDSAMAGWKAEQKVNASLRRELQLTRDQRDRLDEALSTSFLGDIFRSPITHAAAAGAGFAAGLASN